MLGWRTRKRMEGKTLAIGPLVGVNVNRLTAWEDREDHMCEF